MLKVSKSTYSSKSGSIFILEKSMLSFGVKNPLLSPEAAFVFSPSGFPSADSPVSAFADGADEAPLRRVENPFQRIF